MTSFQKSFRSGNATPISPSSPAKRPAGGGEGATANLHPGSRDRQSQSRAAQSGTDATPRKHGAPPSACRILVAGDDSSDRKITESWLISMGHEVVLVSNGREAVGAIHGEERPQFDLIMMDFKMPRMDGIRATRVIRAWESAVELPRSPIIAVTTSASETIRCKCLEAGMDDILVKPYAGAELAAMLKRWLRLADRSI